MFIFSNFATFELKKKIVTLHDSDIFVGFSELANLLSILVEINLIQSSTASEVPIFVQNIGNPICF